MVRCPACGDPLRGDNFIVACDVAICPDCITCSLVNLEDVITRVITDAGHKHTHIVHGITFFAPSIPNARNMTELSIALHEDRIQSVMLPPHHGT